MNRLLSLLLVSLVAGCSQPSATSDGGPDLLADQGAPVAGATLLDPGPGRILEVAMVRDGEDFLIAYGKVPPLSKSMELWLIRVGPSGDILEGPEKLCDLPGTAETMLLAFRIVPFPDFIQIWGQRRGKPSQIYMVQRSRSGEVLAPKLVHTITSSSWTDSFGLAWSETQQRYGLLTAEWSTADKRNVLLFQTIDKELDTPVELSGPPAESTYTGNPWLVEQNGRFVALWRQYNQINVSWTEETDYWSEPVQLCQRPADSEVAQWWPKALLAGDHLLAFWAAHRPTDSTWGQTLGSPLAIATMESGGLSQFVGPLSLGVDNRYTSFWLSAALQDERAWLAWSCDHQTALTQICLSSIDLQSSTPAASTPQRWGDGTYVLGHPVLAAAEATAGLAFVAAVEQTNQLFFRLVP